MAVGKLATLLALVLWPLGSSMAAEVKEASEEIIEEIVVIGRKPGPPLWEIRYQGNTVWLFADISPLPKKFDWDSSYIERIIADADEFLPKPVLDLNVGVTGLFKIWQIRRVTKLQNLRMKHSSGTTLDQVIDSESLLTFKKIMDDWDIFHPSIMKYKPMFAASILYGNVLEETKMENSDAVLKKLESLRRRHRIPETKTEISYNVKEFINYLEETKSLPDNFGTQCLEYLLEEILDMSEIRERNELWFQREISFMEFTDRENMCTKNYREDSQWAKTRHNALKQLWYENLEKAIKSNKNTFAVVDMNLFALPSREFYQWIEVNGFELKEPR